MKKLNILVVEDEDINIALIEAVIESLEHNIVGVAKNYSEAIKLLESTEPDIVLLDIVLDSEKDGLLIAQQIQNKYFYPFIFTTSIFDQNTIEKAKHTNPNGYLIKPIKENELNVALEIAMFKNARNKTKEEQTQKNLFIKDEYKFIKIDVDDIIFIKSDGNYINVQLTKKKHFIKNTLKDFIAKLPSDKFFQVHKSYVINLDFINSVSGNIVYLDRFEVPITRTYRDELLKIMKV